MSAATHLPSVTAPVELHARSGAGFSSQSNGLRPRRSSDSSSLTRVPGLLAIVHVEDGKVIYDRVFPEAG